MQFTIRLFIVAYSLLVIKPALPLAADFMAHTFRSEHHHDHDHDHHHDHLSQDLKKAADTDTPAKKVAFEKESLSIHLAASFDYSLPFAVSVFPDYLLSIPVIYTDPAITTFTPPPQC